MLNCSSFSTTHILLSEMHIFPYLDKQHKYFNMGQAYRFTLGLAVLQDIGLSLSEQTSYHYTIVLPLPLSSI
ncbi:hypothetical protein Trydic_g833 [Trypoxylus dichotomus]